MACQKSNKIRICGKSSAWIIRFQALKKNGKKGDLKNKVQWKLAELLPKNTANFWHNNQKTNCSLLPGAIWKTYIWRTPTWGLSELVVITGLGTSRGLSIKGYQCKTLADNLMGDHCSSLISFINLCLFTSVLLLAFSTAAVSTLSVIVSHSQDLPQLKICFPPHFPSYGGNTPLIWIIPKEKFIKLLAISVDERMCFVLS